MSEERDSQLSAMFDGELPEAECELLARRLGKDAALQARWQRYALIAAAVRSEPGMPLDLGVARRVSLALAAEAPADAEPDDGPLRTMSERLRASRWVKPAAGVAIAAGVAAMSILYLRVQAPADAGDAVVAQAVQPAPLQAAPVAVAEREPESYIVPVAAAETPVPLAPELANYVVAHSEYSSPLGRRNLLTTLVTADARLGREPEEGR